MQTKTCLRQYTWRHTSHFFSHPKRRSGITHFTLSITPSQPTSHRHPAQPVRVTNAAASTWLHLKTPLIAFACGTFNFWHQSSNRIVVKSTTSLYYTSLPTLAHTNSHCYNISGFITINASCYFDIKWWHARKKLNYVWVTKKLHYVIKSDNYQNIRLKTLLEKWHQKSNACFYYIFCQFESNLNKYTYNHVQLCLALKFKNKVKWCK